LPLGAASKLGSFEASATSQYSQLQHMWITHENAVVQSSGSCSLKER
jgi:hypothetical protein